MMNKSRARWLHHLVMLGNRGRGGVGEGLRVTRSDRRTGLALGCATWLLLVSGCVLLPCSEPTFLASLSQEKKEGTESPSGRQVKLGGNSLDLGPYQQAQLRPDDFLAKVNSLLGEDRPEAARRWVERFPDVAHETLCTAEAVPALAFVAQVHEEQCGQGNAMFWRTLINERTRHPEKYAAYLALRRQAAEHLRAGRFAEAATLRLPEQGKKLKSSPLLADAWLLQGMALLRADRPKEAEPALEKGLQLARTEQPYLTAALLLALSEARRRNGQIEAANAAWREAVTLAGQLWQHKKVADPLLWERLATLRPIVENWPQPLLRQFAHKQRWPQPRATEQSSPNLDDEALVWSIIGRTRLERNEAQAALLAFKRAEAMTTVSRLRDQLQLNQAQALLELNQQPAALTLLVRLSAQPDAETAAAALALLGAVRLQEGSSTQGLVLLQRALDRCSDRDWPGRAQAEADLGLAYLTQGDEVNGLRWLHSAQQRFETANEGTLLRQALTNELNYWQHKGRLEEAERVRQRLRALQNS